MKLWQKNTILFFIMALIIWIPLSVKKDSEFLGTDTVAENVVLNINPEFEPWTDRFFPENSGEMETFFFTLQATIGALVVGFILGRMTAKTGNKVDKNKG